MKKILILSGIYKYYRRYITKKTNFALDKDLPWGGYCALEETGPNIVKVKRYLPREVNGKSLLADIMPGVQQT